MAPSHIMRENPTLYTTVASSMMHKSVILPGGLLVSINPILVPALEHLRVLTEDAVGRRKRG